MVPPRQQLAVWRRVRAAGQPLPVEQHVGDHLGEVLSARRMVVRPASRAPRHLGADAAVILPPLPVLLGPQLVTSA